MDEKVWCIFKGKKEPLFAAAPLFTEEDEAITLVIDKPLVVLVKRSEGFTDERCDVLSYIAEKDMYGVGQVEIDESYFFSVLLPWWKRVAVEEGWYECPRCGGYIPQRQNPETVGQWPGALSRTDNKTYVCSECGVEEAFNQWFDSNGLQQQDKWRKQ